MNYLAHLCLADDTRDSLLGSLMGDFVKGPIDPSLAPELQRAIQQHRRIDSFTDGHPIVRQSKRRVSADFRRYAGILIDMFYDHLLATHWHDYRDQPLDVFTGRVYRLLELHRDSLPGPMQRTVRYMVHCDLLGSYRTVNGIHQALRGIEGRLKRPSNLSAAIVELENNREALLGDFSLFFPELIDFVRSENA